MPCAVLTVSQTHNVAVVEGVASYVVSLGQDGKIASQGKWARVLQEDTTLYKELNVGREEFAVEINEISVSPQTGSKKVAANGRQGKLVAPEEISQGNVSWSTGEAICVVPCCDSGLTCM